MIEMIQLCEGRFSDAVVLILSPVGDLDRENGDSSRDRDRDRGRDRSCVIVGVNVNVNVRVADGPNHLILRNFCPAPAISLRAQPRTT